jgi:hypothetical protein
MYNESCFFVRHLISSGKMHHEYWRNFVWVCTLRRRVTENKFEKYLMKEVIHIQNVKLMRNKFFKFFSDVII